MDQISLNICDCWEYLSDVPPLTSDIPPVPNMSDTDISITSTCQATTEALCNLATAFLSKVGKKT